MKIEINLFECENKEEFETALELFKSLKYSSGKYKVNIDTLGRVIKSVELLASYDELKEYMETIK